MPDLRKLQLAFWVYTMVGIELAGASHEHGHLPSKATTALRSFTTPGKATRSSHVRDLSVRGLKNRYKASTFHIISRSLEKISQLIAYSIHPAILVSSKHIVYKCMWGGAVVIGSLAGLRSSIET
jgi:hypothetical protein